MHTLYIDTHTPYGVYRARHT